MFSTKDFVKLTVSRAHYDRQPKGEASTANKLFKIKILLVLCVAVLTVAFSFSNHQVGAVIEGQFTSQNDSDCDRQGQDFIGGPPPSHTGAPGEQTCVVCHSSFELGSGPGTLNINGLPANYTPNQEVQVTVRLQQTDRVYYGFQLTALDQSGRQAGTLILTDPVTTALRMGVVGGNQRRYVQQTFQGAIPVVFDEREWTFRWRAPATLVGPVTFYAAGNATDGSAEPTGDYVYSTSATVSDGTPPTEPIRVVLSRDAGNNLRATITITNPLPDPVPGVQMTLVRASTLDGSAFVDGVSVPQSFGTVNPGQSVVGSVTFPGTASVPSGFAGLVRVDLSFTGGTYSETKNVITP